VNHIDDEPGVREHRDMAAVNSKNLGIHALCRGSLKFGVDRAVVVGHDEPAWLGPPRDARNLLIEQVRDGWNVGGEGDPLFFFGEVAGKAWNPVRQHPQPAVGWRDIAEDVSSREFVLLALGGLRFVRAQGR
jgi:hypothetical protein